MAPIFTTVSVTIFYNVYLQQYGKYLEVDLIGSKATNPNKKNFLASAGDWTQVLSVLSILPCHLIWAISPYPFLILFWNILLTIFTRRWLSYGTIEKTEKYFFHTVEHYNITFLLMFRCLLPIPSKLMRSNRSKSTNRL